MSQRVYLGIDTSCYTTSVAVLAADGSLLGEARQVLSVKQGRCGLQQSEMVFQHTRNLPRLVEEVLQGRDYRLAAVGVSGFPRPLENSYMPAFLAGLGVARSLAALTGAPLEVISHQENPGGWGVVGAGTAGRALFAAACQRRHYGFTFVRAQGKQSLRSDAGGRQH